MSTKKSRGNARTRRYGEPELKLMQLELQEFLGIVDAAIKECRRTRSPLWSFGGPSEDTGRKKLKSFIGELKESVRLSQAGMPHDESASKSEEQEPSNVRTSEEIAYDGSEIQQYGLKRQAEGKSTNARRKKHG